MKNIEKVLSQLFIGIAELFSLILLFDTVNILVNPQSYRTAHGFDEASLQWNSASVLKYLAGNATLLIGILFSLYVGIKNIHHKGANKLWKILHYVLMACFLISLKGGYFYWAKTGFDH